MKRYVKKLCMMAPTFATMIFFFPHFICILVCTYCLRHKLLQLLVLPITNAVYQEPKSKRKPTEEETLSEVSDTTSYFITIITVKANPENVMSLLLSQLL